MRFCSLPQYPESSSYDQRNLEPVIADVKRLMAGYRQDIVDAIENPRLHWKKYSANPFLKALRDV